MSDSTRRPGIPGTAMLCAVIAISTSEGHAQERSPDEVVPAIETENIHWAYSSFLGTGFYRVSGDREVFVLDMPFGLDWREASIDENGDRELGIRFDLPVTLGLHQLDFFDEILDLDNFGTVSFTPGVEVDYLLDERWIVRGYGNLGWGTELSGDEHAWIWNVGIKSRYAFQHRQLDWGVIGEVFHAGYSPDTGSTGALGGFGFGVDAQHPISWRAADDGALDAAWDISYRWYGDALTFRNAIGPDTRIDDEWRFNLGLVWKDRPLKAWFFFFDRFSIGYRFSSSGDFRGITFSFSAPLDR